MSAVLAPVGDPALEPLHAKLLAAVRPEFATALIGIDVDDEEHAADPRPVLIPGGAQQPGGCRPRCSPVHPRPRRAERNDAVAGDAERDDEQMLTEVHAVKHYRRRTGGSDRLAASTAVGLEVMAEMMDAEVTEPRRCDRSEIVRCST